MATQADLDQLNDYLAEAKTARHKVAVGEKVQVIWRLGGNRRQHHISTVDELDRYIKRLKAEIVDCQEELGVSTGTRSRWAIGVRF